MSQSLMLSLSGFAMGVSGVYVNWGLGWALLVGGVVLFVVGGLNARREDR